VRVSSRAVDEPDPIGRCRVRHELDEILNVVPEKTQVGTPAGRPVVERQLDYIDGDRLEIWIAQAQEETVRMALGERRGPEDPPVQELRGQPYAVFQTSPTRGFTVVPKSEYSSMRTPVVRLQSGAKSHSSCR
jgi:hypothetical protein